MIKITVVFAALLALATSSYAGTARVVNSDQEHVDKKGGFFHHDENSHYELFDHDPRMACWQVDVKKGTKTFWICDTSQGGGH